MDLQEKAVRKGDAPLFRCNEKEQDFKVTWDVPALFQALLFPLPLEALLLYHIHEWQKSGRLLKNIFPNVFPMIPTR